MKGHEFIFRKSEQWPALVSWLRESLKKGIEGGAVIITLSRESRTAMQNRKMWPMLTDISSQCKWASRELSPEHWKLLFVSAYKQEINSVIMGFNGEPVNLNLSSSELNKSEFCELIEFIYAHGTELGVKFTEPALRIYEEFSIK